MQTTLDLATEPTASLSLFVPGKPATAGNKSAFPFKRPDGSLGVRVTEGRTGASREHARSWRDDLRSAATAAAEREGWEMPGAKAHLSLTVVIVRARPKGHMGTGRNEGVVKPALIERRPVERPDTLKLVRAIEDALTGILWHDDSVFCDHDLRKRFGDQLPDGAPLDEGVHLRVTVG